MTNIFVVCCDKANHYYFHILYHIKKSTLVFFIQLVIRIKSDLAKFYIKKIIYTIHIQILREAKTRVVVKDIHKPRELKPLIW